MKKICSVLLVFLLSLSSLMFSPLETEARTKFDFNRISGETRLGTAINVSQTGWPDGLTTDEKAVVLARADDPADALAAASLAGVKDSPILLTYPKSLDDSVLIELTRLGAKKVYLLGGTSAISNTVETTLKSHNFTVQRIEGANRYETAFNINKTAGTSNNTKAILANGETVADALSASAYSSIHEIPIYLTMQDKMRVNLPSNIKEVDIFGGPAAISTTIEKQLKSKGITVNRYGGANRYETSILANLHFVESGKIIMVRGESVKTGKEDYPDAVAASGLANKLNAKILLVHPTKNYTITDSYINNKNFDTYVLGGLNAITDDVMEGYGYNYIPSLSFIQFFDAGKGDSILIQGQNKEVLIDGGGLTDNEELFTKLKYEGVDKIDYLISTNPAPEHIGGLTDVINEFEVSKVLDSGSSDTSSAYTEYKNLIEQKNIPYEVPAVGSTLSFDEMTIKVLNNGEKKSATNDGSLVLQLTYGDVSFMLTSDATKGTEADILKTFSKSELQSSILKVGNHGSDESTSQAFLDAVRPSTAILSHGDESDLSDEVVNRLKENKVTMYSTNKSGDILAYTNGAFPYTINEAPFTGDDYPATGKLDITGLDLDQETVTIKNVDNVDVLMAGWKLLSVEGNQTYEFPDYFVLKSGASVTVTAGRNAVDSPPSKLYWTGAYIWNNSGDKAVLYDPQGKVIDEMTK
ncbi:cell wall-binding repeat-containing protein [Bacillus salacetis]|uniref:cell wall-binding repeat-containing protein n=1 Tax=Bacillus salacetis TaxID=2315464 RepID=UPI003B9E7AB9